MPSEQSTTSDGPIWMYRFEDRLISSGYVDEWGWYVHGSAKVEVHLFTFKVIRETTKGKWIDYFGADRFVLNDSHKKFAHPTKEAALESFLARKQRQCHILAKQLERAQTAIVVASGKTDDLFS